MQGRITIAQSPSARYCAGDVAGERGGREGSIRPLPAGRVLAFELWDPDIEVVNFDAFPVTRPYHGWDGMLGWLADISEPFDEFQLELAEVLSHHEEHVVTTLRATGNSRTGGPPFELVWGAVWTLRGGKIVRVEGLRTPEEALEAAGRRE